MVRSIFILMYFLTVQGVIAQRSVTLEKMDSLFYRKLIEVRAHNGGHLYTGEKLNDVLKRSYWSVDMRVGWYSKGYNYWDVLYRYPCYGLGVYYAYLQSPRILGNPSAFYGFINIPFFQKDRWSLNYDISLGLSYDFEQYHSKKNPLNDAIGSDVNTYISFAVQGQFRMSNHIDFIYGLDYTHFSNGRTTTPNSGLNLVGANLGLRYNYKSLKLYPDRYRMRLRTSKHQPYFSSKISDFTPFTEWNVFMAWGRCATYATDINRSRRYTNLTLSIDRMFRYHHKYSVGIGLDLFYDGSMIRYFDEDYPPLKKMFMSGVHLGHHWHFYRFTLLMQLATYLYKETPARGKWYSRLGLRYDIFPGWFGQISLKSQNGTKADFMEWGFGFRIP